MGLYDITLFSLETLTLPKAQSTDFWKSGLEQKSSLIQLGQSK